MRYCFSGHESFPCKSMWLKKGYDYLVDRNRFTDPDAVVKLGVGKNMVQSIRFWLRAFGLLNDDEATEIAHYLFDDRDGRDPYAEDNATLWILHYMLVVTAVSSIYRLFFVDLQREKKEFDKEQVLSFIKRKCNVPEQKNVFNENTVKKDIRVLLQNYLAPTSPKGYEEYASILLELGLLRENEGKYLNPEKPDVPLNKNDAFQKVQKRRVQENGERGPIQHDQSPPFFFHLNPL